MQGRLGEAPRVGRCCVDVCLGANRKSLEIGGLNDRGGTESTVAQKLSLDNYRALGVTKSHRSVRAFLVTPTEAVTTNVTFGPSSNGRCNAVTPPAYSAEASSLYRAALCRSPLA